MKKVAGLFICAIMIVGGIFFANNIVSYNHQSKTQLEQDVPCYESDNTKNIVSNNNGYVYHKGYSRLLYEGSTLTYSVYLINFCDYEVFNESTYKKYYKKFEDVQKWFIDESNGKFCPQFNFYVYNTDKSVSFMDSNGQIADYTKCEEAAEICQKANNEGTLLSYYGPCDKQIFVGSYPKMIIGGDAYVYENTIVVPSDCRYFSWVHEMLHTLGIPDLYAQDEYSFVKDHETSSGMVHDIMHGGIYDNIAHPVLNVFDKIALNWVDEGTCGDGVTNYVENITKDGHYTIYTPTTKNNVIAYKLPYDIDSEQSFYLELREFNNCIALSVNRINTTYLDSYDAINIASLRGATLFEVTKNNNFDLVNEIYDAQNRKINIVITDIKFIDNKVEFNLMVNAVSDSFTIELQLNDSTNYSTVVSIYVDNDFICTAQANSNKLITVKINDIVRVESEYFETYEYPIDELFLVKEKKIITVSLIPKKKTVLPTDNSNDNNQSNQQQTTTNKCKFEIFYSKDVANSFSNVYLSPNLSGNVNNVYITVNGIVYNYNKNTIFQIENNSNISIKYENTIKYYFYSNNFLKDLTTNKKTIATVENGVYTFSFEIDKEEYTGINISFVKEDGTSKLLDVVSIQGYNSKLCCLETFEFVGEKENRDNIFIFCDVNYTYLVIKYQNYLETKEVILTLQTNIIYYTLTVSQDGIQSGLDWFFGIFS